MATRGNIQHAGTPEDPLDAVFTASNVVTFVRLCLIPVFFFTLLAGHDLAACILFALAACTDWVDGQLARRTNTVSKLGRILDPCVDRLLMIFGVLGVYLVGRLPVWIIVVVLVRDLALIGGYGILLRRWRIRIDVVYAGKFCTTLFFVGFAALVLNYPPLQGLGLVNVSWLPGLNGDVYSWGIWFVYAGLLLGIYTTFHYLRAAISLLKSVQASVREG